MTNDAEQILKEMNTGIDELITCQREEQDIILNRRTAELPAITMRIGHLTLQVQERQSRLDSVLQGRAIPEEIRHHVRNYTSKFHLLQELTLQNHLLLENSLAFLKELFAMVLGEREPNDVYNSLGITSARFGQSGGFFEVKV